MKFQDLDRKPDGSRPVACALRWLDTLIHSPAVSWEPDQRDAALAALQDAREVMAADALYLAGSRARVTPGGICDPCETVAHCSRAGCIPTTPRVCGNAACGWEGSTDRHCGTVGPLCPECGEVTEARA